MTLCIAAVARSENKIVTVSDFMLSTDADSAETPATKIVPIGQQKRWLVMYAGYPSMFIEVCTEVRSRLANTNEDARDLISAFRGAFQDRLEKKIEDEILSPYGMSRDQFIKEGRDAFGDEEFLNILRVVQGAELETEFLVAGFEGDKTPCILSVCDPGVATIHDIMSFHAIGCGDTLANTSLMSNFNPFDSLTDIIYRVSEAKFIGQKAPGVGKATFLTVLSVDGSWIGIRKENMSKVEELWQRNKQPVPDEAGKMLTESFFNWSGRSD